MFQVFDFTVLAAGGGDLPPFMTPHLQVLLWSIFVFFTLLGLLWKFAWGPIMHALEEREHNIQKTIDDAEKKNAEAIAKVALDTGRPKREVYRLRLGLKVQALSSVKEEKTQK